MVELRYINWQKWSEVIAKCHNIISNTSIKLHIISDKSTVTLDSKPRCYGSQRQPRFLTAERVCTAFGLTRNPGVLWLKDSNSQFVIISKFPSATFCAFVSLKSLHSFTLPLFAASFSLSVGYYVNCCYLKEHLTSQFLKGNSITLSWTEKYWNVRSLSVPDIIVWSRYGRL
jgi:hypothetical protein